MAGVMESNILGGLGGMSTKSIYLHISRIPVPVHATKLTLAEITSVAPRAGTSEGTGTANTIAGTSIFTGITLTRLTGICRRKTKQSQFINLYMLCSICLRGCPNRTV